MNFWRRQLAGQGDASWHKPVVHRRSAYRPDRYSLSAAHMRTELCRLTMSATSATPLIPLLIDDQVSPGRTAAMDLRTQACVIPVKKPD